jgi:signal transduction histidine kinase/tetratricopeptide (TPR) repeat protein
MFLRAQNETPEVRARIASLDERVAALRGSTGAAPAPENARARLDLGGILCWRGHYRATLELIEPLTTGDFPREVAMEARQIIGDSHYRHDQYDMATKQYRESLEFASEVGDDYWCARAEDGIAWVLIDVGHYSTDEFAEASRIFERLRPFHRDRGDRITEGFCVYGMSRALAGMGRYKKAVELAQESIEILKREEGDFLLQAPLLQLANVERDRGNFDQARPFYEAALEMADRNQDPYFQVLTALEYGMLLRFVNETDAAIKLWRTALGPVKELDFPRIGHEISSRLSAAVVEWGDFEEAYHLQIACQEFGNRVGVMSPVLQNQQMLLRSQMHRTAQLEETLNYLRVGIEASLDGVFVLSTGDEGLNEDTFVIRFVNEAGARALGKSTLNVMDLPVKTAWKTESADVLLAHSIEVFESGEPRTVDPIELEFMSGIAGWYSVKIAKIADGVVWTLSDVTARQAMQREIVAQRDRLTQANARLTALDREKSEMLGIAAHDLRSPIGNIRSLCELIPTEDPEAVDLLRTIEEISDSLLLLIGNLLDVEKIERGELELELTHVDVGPLAAQIVDQFSADASQKAIQMLFDRPKLGLGVKADPSALRRILQNLLSNAIKFSPYGAAVSVRVGEVGSKVRIEIQDRGKGITESDRKKLFAKFARLSARPTAGESSTGLGLSIVKQLVEAMNGQVGCESEPTQGATFWVEFAKAAPAVAGKREAA